MFGLRKQPPPLCPSNTGRMGTGGQVNFGNGTRTWTEHFDVVALAAAALDKSGHRVSSHKSWLEHGDTGFILQPQLVDMQILDKGGIRTATTVQVNHPTLIPAGTFEYQHATGDSVADSLAQGFDQWVQADFATLLDALRDKPLSCTAMEMAFPAKGGRPPWVRRAVLGPPTHMAQTAPRPDAENDHPFCPCCLLTNSFEAFRELMEADSFYGLRLFAFRDADGEPQADCRVNGDDWEKGAQALRAYARTWPAAPGFELRKQYVVLQTIERPSGMTSSHQA